MKKVKIAIVGFGNIGSFLFNELKNKSEDIEIKTGKKISIVAISAKNINKNIIKKIPNLMM
jgi:homoserine dehydrogenase